MSIKGDVAEGAGVGCSAPKRNSGGECYFNPREQMKPNNDDHLYDA